MDNTCQTCGNDLDYGDCGNLLIYCTHCEWHIGVQGEYINPEYDNEWIKNWDKYNEE